MDIVEKFRLLILDLQQTLAKADIQERYLKHEKKRPNVRPKLVFILEKMKVRMDGTKKHSRPHIHLDIGTSKHAASIAIDDGSILAGSLKRGQQKLIQAWVIEKKRALNNLWKAMQNGEHVEPLICKFKEKIM